MGEPCRWDGAGREPWGVCPELGSPWVTPQHPPHHGWAAKQQPRSRRAAGLLSSPGMWEQPGVSLPWVGTPGSGRRGGSAPAGLQPVSPGRPTCSLSKYKGLSQSKHELFAKAPQGHVPALVCTQGKLCTETPAGAQGPRGSACPAPRAPRGWM